MKMNNYFKRSLLALFTFLPLYLVAQIVTVSPSHNTVFENQVGKDLPITITYQIDAVGSGGADVIYLVWTNPDSPLLEQILLDSQNVTYNGDGYATMNYTFPGDYWRLDTTGNYKFFVTNEGGTVYYDHDGDENTADVPYTWNAVSTTFTYYVPENGMPPTSQITFPANGAMFTPGQTITITADAHDGDGEITRVEFILGNNFDTGTGNETYSTVLASDTEAPYSTTFTIPGEGEFKLSARAFDEHGNSGRSPIVTFFGSYTPVLEKLTSITMLTPLDGSSLSAINPITLSVDVQPASLRSMVIVDYFINGYKVNSDPVTADGISGFFNYAWTKPYIGTHSITARAQLSNGTFVETSNAADVSVVGIGSAPDVTLSLTPGDSRVVGSDATFYVHAGDSGALVQTLYFYVNGVIYETLTDASALASFPYTFDFHFPAPGPYEFWVLSESSNGNRGISNIIEMTVGMGNPPSVTLISPIYGTQFLPGTDMPILVQANDPNSLINTIQYYVNDTNVANAVRNNDGSFTVIETSVSTSLFTYHFRYAGDYRVYVTAMDESGIIAQSDIVTVRVRELDPTQPRVIMSHPLPVGGGDTFNDVSVGSSMFLNAIATDGDGQIQFVKFFINGQLIGSSVTHFRDSFSFYFEPTTPGTYIIYAEAVDNHAKRTQSVPLQLNVYALEAQLPIVNMLPIADEDRVVDAGARVSMRATANGGLVTISQLNFYVNGVLVDAVETPDENEVYASSIVLEEPGTYFLNVRAIEIDPLGLTTDNWVISDAVSVMVTPSSSSRAFVARTYQDFVDDLPSQSIVDQEVIALDTGQKTQAQYVYELMQSDDFLNTEYALMTRFLLTGIWPNRTILRQDMSNVTSGGLDQLVNMLLPNFQTGYWGGQRIPDGFSTDQEFRDFIKILFNNKYGEDPNSAQTDRCVWLLSSYGGVSFIADFVRDTEATQFGAGTMSTILGIPNPPNARLLDLAQTASLFVNLLRITPSLDEVGSLSQLPLIERIQTILADSRFAAR